MRFSPYAKPLVLVFSLGIIADIAVVLLLGILISVPLALLIVAVSLPVPLFLLIFLRDPVRTADMEQLSDRIMYAPADGKVTEISRVQDDRLGGKVVRIGIFLSIFDVHINRSPCKCRVISVETPEAASRRFLNARNPRSSELNLSTDLVLAPESGPIVRLPERIMVRQIAGLIARRIVCGAAVGEELKAGQRFGMILFGSRTELIVPDDDALNVLVTVGQKIYAGNDPLIEYR